MFLCQWITICLSFKKLVILCWSLSFLIPRCPNKAFALKVFYILRWPEVKREPFLKRLKDHLKDFPNLLVFSFGFVFGDRRLVINRVFKGKKIEKIARHWCRKSQFQKIKKTANCSLYISLAFLHFHQNDPRSVPSEKGQANDTLLSDEQYYNSYLVLSQWREMVLKTFKYSS